MVRHTHASCPWPQYPIHFRQETMKLYWSLKQVGSVCLQAIGQSVCASKEKYEQCWLRLCEGLNSHGKRRESEVKDAAGQGLLAQTEERKEAKGEVKNDGDVESYEAFPPTSYTLMDMFNYFQPPEPGKESCAAHTDFGLLTLIPPQQGGAGLEVYNLATGHWDTIEKERKANECIVFGGDSMDRLTGGFIMYGAHRVVVPDEASYPRVSTPFILMANPHAVLDPSCVRPDLLVSGHSTEPMRGGDCVAASVSSKPSVTFDKRYLDQRNAQRAERRQADADDQLLQANAIDVEL